MSPLPLATPAEPQPLTFGREPSPGRPGGPDRPSSGRGEPAPAVLGPRPGDGRGGRPVMTAATRLALAALVVVTLGLLGAGQLFGLDALQGWSAGVFLLIELGIAPCLLWRPMSFSWFALLAVAGSIAGTIGIGFTMGILHDWHPATAMVGTVVVTLALLTPSVVRDVRRLARGRDHQGLPGATEDLLPRPGSGELTVGVATAVGLALTVLASATHQGNPQPAGLYLIVGPLWYLGLAILVAAILYARRAHTTPALPVLTLSGVVVLSQAIVYGSPTVATAARHVGVVQYVRAHGGLEPGLDIYQAWSGLFAGAAWLCDVGRIADPMTVATWWPVLLSIATALASVLLAGRWLPGLHRPWLAGLVFSLTSTLNIVYFSPQSVGVFFAITIFALAVCPYRPHREPEGHTLEETPIGSAQGATWPSGGPASIRQARRRRPLAALGAWLADACAPMPPGVVLLILLLSCTMAVTHQISPYLTVAALGLLWILGYMRPLWVLVLVLGPALMWAGANTRVLGRFISLGAVGRFWENAESPSHQGTQLPVPEVTRLAFDIPALLLLAVGLLAAACVLRYRTRPAWALAIAGASPALLFAATNYGQEGIFRVTLFAAPWLSVLAVGFAWPRAARRWLTPVLAAGIAIILAGNAFGQTALDWNRVLARDTPKATAQFENTAPDGSIMLVTGSSIVTPVKITAHYFNIEYLDRSTLSPFPAPDKPYDAAADVLSLTRKLVKGFPAPRYYALVSDSTGAYDARYGYQTYANYEKLAAAMAASPLWRPVFTGPTTTMYVLAKKPSPR